MKRSFEETASHDRVYYDTLELRRERHRAKNREHAKNTRIRKKEMFEGMKRHLSTLQYESLKLRRLVEESEVANALLFLGNEGTQSAPTIRSSLFPLEEDIKEWIYDTENIFDHLKKEVRSEASHSHGQQHSNHNVPTSPLAATSSEDFEDEDQDNDSLSHSKDAMTGETRPEVVRRAKNRVHAKLTRDRKRLLTVKAQEAIMRLEDYNEQLKIYLQSLCPSFSLA